MGDVSELPLRRVYLAYSLEQLTAVIMEQGQQVMREAGVEFSIRAAPIVLALMQNGALTAADIAKELGDPHQLVTQRVEALIELQVVTRVADRADARRKLLKITAKGYDQLKRLKDELDLLELVYQRLFSSLGVDLAAKTLDAIDALERSPLLERLQLVEAGNRKTQRKKPAK